ncbi:carboxy methyl transferase for protein phosphatase 2A [Mitosporidium daphniae]
MRDHQDTARCSLAAGIYHTDIESALARLSAVKKGYLRDGYIHKFIPEDALSSFQCKLPIFNRGAFVRASFFDQIVREFLSCNGPLPCQIVNLGCGWDTQWLRLHEEHIGSLSFFDIDFQEIITSKLERLGKDFESKCSAQNSTSRYIPISGDLNQFIEHIAPSLLKEGFDPAIPTLVITEVVLIYLREKPTLRILEWFSSTLKSPSIDINESSPLKQEHPKAAQSPNGLFGVTLHKGRSYFITLDPSSFSDPFGMMMIKNLESSSIYLVNELLLSGRSKFEGSLRSIDWKVLNAFTMREAYEKYISKDEKKRISLLEWVDELEEWNLLSSHYYFSVFVLEKANDT